MATLWMNDYVRKPTRTLLMFSPLVVSLAMAFVGTRAAREGRILIDFSAAGGAMGSLGVIVGCYRTFARGHPGRAKRSTGLGLVCGFALLIGSMCAVAWHGHNLRLSRLNRERWRQQQVAPIYERPAGTEESGWNLGTPY